MKRDVLDHGFVELIEHMGSDQRIVDAARVSIAGDHVKPSSTNRHLIRYLLRHSHTTPFETVRFTFAVKAPIFVVRQHFRHRMGTFNEMSARYGVLPEEFYVPDLSRMNVQAKDNHQGSGADTVADPAYVAALIRNQSKIAFETYHELLNTGLSRELARSVLPVNTYTQYYWTVDLWNLMHFLRLRLDGHAQYEIRVYGEAILDLIREHVPLAVEAFEDYILDAKKFSGKELSILSVDEHFTDDILEQKLGSKREVQEFKDKLGV